MGAIVALIWRKPMSPTFIKSLGKSGAQCGAAHPSIKGYERDLWL